MTRYSDINSGTTAIYDQRTGSLHLPNGDVIRAGSGKRDSRGNFQPDKQGVRAYGPIPAGVWNVANAAPHTYNLKGGRTDTTLSLYLSPQAGTNTLGRGGFFMHHPHSANNQSIGCIVMADADVQKLASLRRSGQLTQIKVVPALGVEPSPTRYAQNGDAEPKRTRAVRSAATANPEPAAKAKRKAAPADPDRRARAKLKTKAKAKAKIKRRPENGETRLAHAQPHKTKRGAKKHYAATGAPQKRKVRTASVKKPDIRFNMF